MPLPGDRGKINCVSAILKRMIATVFTGDAAIELDDFYHKAGAETNAERLAAMERELGAPKEHYVMSVGKPVDDLGWLRLLEYEFLSLRDLVDLVLV